MHFILDLLHFILEHLIAIFGIALPAWLAWLTYRKREKLERAKWMQELYEKFYERSDLKKFRDLVDSEEEDIARRAELNKRIEEESPEFTDYLNFFEFLGYLEESKQISEEEIRGMFHYYLANIKRNGQIVKYIRDPKKGFEKLEKLLNKINE